MRYLLLPFALLYKLLIGVTEGVRLFPGGVFSVLKSFFYSPWGLLMPMCGIVLSAVCMFGISGDEAKSVRISTQIAQTPDSEVHMLLEKLGDLGNVGIVRLVEFLGSERESLVLGSRDVINRTLDQHAVLPIEETDEFYLSLSKSLVKNFDSFGPSAKSIAGKIGERILRDILDATDEKTESGSKTRYSRRSGIVANCELLLVMTENERRLERSPQVLDSLYADSLGGEPPRASFDMDVDAMRALVGNGSKKSWLDEEEHDYPRFDRFSTSRAELLYALHNTKDVIGSRRKDERIPSLRSEMMLAENSAETTSSFGMSGSIEPAAMESFPESKIASHYERHRLEEADELQKYLEEQEELRKIETKIPFENTPLGTTPLEDYIYLDANELMRLLHHADQRCGNRAKDILREKDGFRNSHMELAFRLHHPNDAVRKELVSMLPNDTTLNPYPWLLVLLDDISPEVRYASASFLATANDESIVRKVLDKARIDDDPKMQELARRIESRNDYRVP